MYVLAPPPAPSNVSVKLGDNRVLLGWAVPTIPRVLLTFKVTLKTTVDETVILHDRQNWQFAITEQTCGPYRLEIVVSNIAGRNSTTVTGELQDCSDTKKSYDNGLNLSFQLILITLTCDFIVVY